jgi:NTP pyrophosphatase (non-canonical NTP hydrolase)
MHFTDYQKACLRTASMGLGPQVEMCVRALGLCGETEELSRTIFAELGTDDQIVKEAGDVLWYAAALAHMFGLDGEALGLEDLSRAKSSPLDGRWCKKLHAENAMVAACQLAELVKKHVGHGKPANLDKVKGLLFAIVYKTGQCVPNGVTLAQVAAINVEKLKARYPAGFDMAIASKKADSDAPVIDIRPRNVDADGRQVEEAEALAEVETVGHYPAGGVVGEWKPGPV